MATGRHLNIRIGGDPEAAKVTCPPISPENARARAPGTPFLGIHFVDCHVYGRVYRNKAGSHYEGLCPKCRRAVKIRIGPSGSTTRSFKAFCD